MFLIINLVCILAGAFGVMYGLGQRFHVQTLKAKCHAENVIAVDFERLAKDRDEYIKRLTEERDQLAAELYKLSCGHGKSRRNFMTELENITGYDGTDRGQKDYEE